jgi:hypothetical protein
LKKIIFSPSSPFFLFDIEKISVILSA